MSEWLYVRTVDPSGAPVPPHAATTDPAEAVLSDEIEALVRATEFLSAVRAAGRDVDAIDLVVVELDCEGCEIPRSAAPIGDPFIR
jgi:hypothetical protein